MRSRLISGLTAGLVLTGCAHNANQIEAQYVPVSAYSAASCEDLLRDIDGVGRQMVKLGAKQDMQVEYDKQVMAFAWFVTWPALFFVKGDRDSPQLAHAKGEFVALQRAAVAKGCVPQSVISDPRFAAIPPPLPKVDDVGYGYDKKRR